MTTQDAEGNTLRIGDVVEFKYDIEQFGTIKNISIGGKEVHLTSEYGFHGEYIGGEKSHVHNANECFRVQ